MNDFFDIWGLFPPLLAAILCWLYLWSKLYRADTPLPLSDVGLIFATFVLSYTIFPLLNAMFVGEQTSFLTDNRLLVLRPSPEQVGSFMWNYVAFLACFIATYVKVRRQSLTFSINGNDARKFMPGIVASVAVLSLFFLVLDLTSGVSTSTSYESGVFLDNVDRYANLPLFIRQVTGHLGGILFVTKIALAACIATNIREGNWRLFGGIWLAYEFLLPFFELGARSNSFFIAITFIITYHNTVRPISAGVLALGTVPLLIAYLVQGVVRSGSALSEIGFFEALLTSNEFQSVFATAYDMKVRIDEQSATPSVQLYFADFLRVIPQQMLPFEKLDPAQWYLELIGYKGTGVGFSFGLISEGEMGLGWPDIMMRGVFLGALLGWIHNLVTKHSHHFGWIVFYLWLCTRVYLSFRNSTLYWLALIFLQLLPAVIFINMVKKGAPIDKIRVR